MTTTVTTTCDKCGEERGSVVTGGMTWQEAQTQAVGWYERISLDGSGHRRARKHYCTRECLMDGLREEQRRDA